MTTPDLPAEAITTDAAHAATRAFWESMEAAGFSWSPRVDEALRKALEAAAPAIREQAAAAERERIAKALLAEADRGRKIGLDRIALRAFAADLLRDQPQPAEPEVYRYKDGSTIPIVPGNRKQPQPQPAGADAQPGDTRPRTMLQPVTFSDDDEGELRLAKLREIVDDRDSDTQPDPYIDTLAAQHGQEFEPDDQDNDHG